MTGLPAGPEFVDWRKTSKFNVESIKKRLAWPLGGLIFDMEHNSFWYSGWGEKPSNLIEATELMIKKYKEIPKLIPIYSHRYIPSSPHEVNNPIYSVHQSDIICYGSNLEEYFRIEFHEITYEDMNFGAVKKIDFWTHMVATDEYKEFVS